MFAVCVEKMSEFKLELKPELQASHHDVSINSSTGAVLFQSSGEPVLHKFSLRQDGLYINEWRRQCPENKRWMRSYLTDTGDVILQDQNDRTCLFNQDMQLINSWHQKGYLIGCLPGPRTVYMVANIKHYGIDIRSQDGEILHLKPQKIELWCCEQPDGVSVCEDVTTGILVVTNRNGNMAVFSRGGKSQRIMKLLFRI